MRSPCEDSRADEILALTQRLNELTNINRRLEQANAMLTTPPEPHKVEDAGDENSQTIGDRGVTDT